MANLLEKASILITPTAYDVGSINAIKPIDTIGDELVTNGDFSDGSTGWNLGTQWSIVNNEAVYVGDGSSNTLNCNMTLIKGKTYRVKFNVLSISGTGKVQMQIGIDNTFNTVGEKTFDVTIENNPNSFVSFARKSGIVSMTIDDISVKEIINADLDFERATSGSVVGTANRENADGVLEQVAQNVPRIDYLGGEGHWLIEPQSTNLVTYSDELSQVSEWVKIGFATVNNNQAIAPTDTLIADEVLSGDNSALNGLRIDKSVVSGDDYTFSFFAKKKDTDTNYVAIRFDSFNSAFSLKRAWFNIDSGSLGTVESGITAKIEDYGDGWYRCSATQTATATASSRVLMMLTSDDNVSSLGVGLGFYGFGGQFEQQSCATSYIPTSGSAATRAKDSFGLNTTLDTSLIDSTEGTFYVEMAALDNNLINRNISLSDGDDSNTIRFEYKNVSNQLKVSVKVVTSQASFITTSYDVTNFLKIGLRFKENDFACFVNGSQVGVTDTFGSTFPPNTLNHIKSARGGNALAFEGKVKCIAVFKEGLTDSELTCLTS